MVPVDCTIYFTQLKGPLFIVVKLEVCCIANGKERLTFDSEATDERSVYQRLPRVHCSMVEQKQLYRHACSNNSAREGSYAEMTCELRYVQREVIN